MSMGSDVWFKNEEQMCHIRETAILLKQSK